MSKASPKKNILNRIFGKSSKSKVSTPKVSTPKAAPINYSEMYRAQGPAIRAMMSPDQIEFEAERAFKREEAKRNADIEEELEKQDALVSLARKNTAAEEKAALASLARKNTAAEEKAADVAEAALYHEKKRARMKKAAAMNARKNTEENTGGKKTKTRRSKSKRKSKSKSKSKSKRS